LLDSLNQFQYKKINKTIFKKFNFRQSHIDQMQNYRIANNKSIIIKE